MRIFVWYRFWFCIAFIILWNWCAIVVHWTNTYTRAHTKFYLILAIFIMLIQNSLNDAWLWKMNGIQICRREEKKYWYHSFEINVNILCSMICRWKSSRTLAIYLFFFCYFIFCCSHFNTELCETKRKLICSFI